MFPVAFRSPRDVRNNVRCFSEVGLDVYVCVCVMLPSRSTERAVMFFFLFCFFGAFVVFILPSKMCDMLYTLVSDMECRCCPVSRVAASKSDAVSHRDELMYVPVEFSHENVLLEPGRIYRRPVVCPRGRRYGPWLVFFCRSRVVMIVLWGYDSRGCLAPMLIGQGILRTGEKVGVTDTHRFYLGL